MAVFQGEGKAFARWPCWRSSAYRTNARCCAQPMWHRNQNRTNGNDFSAGFIYVVVGIGYLAVVAARRKNTALSSYWAVFQTKTRETLPNSANATVELFEKFIAPPPRNINGFAVGHYHLAAIAAGIAHNILKIDQVRVVGAEKIATL